MSDFSFVFALHPPGHEESSEQEPGGPLAPMRAIRVRAEKGRRGPSAPQALGAIRAHSPRREGDVPWDESLWKVRMGTGYRTTGGTMPARESMPSPLLSVQEDALTRSIPSRWLS